MTPAKPPASAWITGASGFIGRVLGARLPSGWQALHFGSTDWRGQLARAELRDAVIYHLAARVHGPEDAAAADYHRDNVEKTKALAAAARDAGARRLVFLSTIKVNGEETGDRPFTAQDTPHPLDDYARSKWEAEQLLRTMEGLDTCIVRSPLVYGPGAAGNLRSLVRLADSPWPLPLGAIHNRRSFVHVADLANLLVLCASHEAAANATFVAAHEKPASTTQVIAALRRSLGRGERLFALGAGTLEALAALVGGREKAHRLTRNLEVDASETTRSLGWKARIGIDDAVGAMARAYREAKG